MSVEGERGDRPNPAMPTLAPSPRSATASAAVVTLPMTGRPPGLRVLDDPVGDDGGDLGVVLLQHHRVAVAAHARLAEPDLVHRRPARAQVLRGGVAGRLEAGA